MLLILYSVLLCEEFSRVPEQRLNGWLIFGFGLHVWGCVLDGAFWNSNTPSKTQWHTCAPNGWVRQNIWHQNAGNRIKKKKKNEACSKEKDSTKALIHRKSREFYVCCSWKDWSITEPPLVSQVCSAWCWHEHHIHSAWKVALLDDPP